MPILLLLLLQFELFLRLLRLLLRDHLHLCALLNLLLLHQHLLLLLLCCQLHLHLLLCCQLHLHLLLSSSVLALHLLEHLLPLQHRRCLRALLGRQLAHGASLRCKSACLPDGRSRTGRAGTGGTAGREVQRALLMTGQHSHQRGRQALPCEAVGRLPPPLACIRAPAGPRFLAPNVGSRRVAPTTRMSRPPTVHRPNRPRP